MNVPIRDAHQPKRIVKAIQDLMKQTGQVPHDTSTLTGMQVQPPAGQGTSEAGRVKSGGAQIPATTDGHDVMGPVFTPDTSQKPQTQGTSDYTQQLMDQPQLPQPKPLVPVSDGETPPPMLAKYQGHITKKEVTELTVMLNMGLINFDDYHNAIQQMGERI